MIQIALVVLSYLLGSIPVGLLLARLKGVDIQKVGSGNIGATNVFRSVGKGWGVATLVGDALKGFVPALFFPMIGKNYPAVFQCLENPAVFGLVCGVAAIAGHNWPIYLRFKGGKGVSTSMGVVLGIAPAAVGIGVIIFAAIVALTRYVSLASIVAAAIVPVAGWFLYSKEGIILPVALTILGLLIIWRHRTNIQRLLNGTERRFGSQKSEARGQKSEARDQRPEAGDQREER